MTRNTNEQQRTGCQASPIPAVECSSPGGIRSDPDFQIPSQFLPDAGSSPSNGGQLLIPQHSVENQRDIILGSAAERGTLKDDRVGAIMTGSAEYCLEDQEASEAAAQMRKAGVRQLTVFNRRRQLVGIVSLEACERALNQLSTSSLDSLSASEDVNARKAVLHGTYRGSCF